MKGYTLLKTLACLLILGICGLATLPLLPWAAADVARNTVERTHLALADSAESTQLQRETFSLLQEKFQGPMLDRDFETLRKLVSDETYLDFLRRAYPMDTPVKTFEEFFQMALPPVERYLDFWRKHVEDVDELDADALAILHKFLVANWHMIIRGFHGEKSNVNAILPIFTAGAPENPLAPFAKNRELSAARFANILIQMVFFADETQEAGAEKVKVIIDTHGQDRGLVWLALREPILLGQILLSFTDTDIFLKWVGGEFHRKEKEQRQ